MGSTVSTLVAVFPGSAGLLDPAVLDQAAELSASLDRRRLRKAVAAACAPWADAQGNPERLTGDDLLATIREMGAQA